MSASTPAAPAPDAPENLTSLDQENARFWKELCGTNLAQHLDVEHDAPEHWRRFDEAYVSLYPYLLGYVRPEQMAGQRVLEVGLGYGTLGQRLASVAGQYVGLDVSPGPVAMMRARLRAGALPGTAIRGSMLACPLQSESVDHVVSIGCFHHTGNLQRCIDETHRVLRPGGRAVVMVYNQLSYRQWARWPWRTLRSVLRPQELDARGEASEQQRKAYDADSAGRIAPETVFASTRALRQAFRRFSQVDVQKENCTDMSFQFAFTRPKPAPPQEAPAQPTDRPYARGQWSVHWSFALGFPRQALLASLGRRLGLDLYVVATK